MTLIFEIIAKSVFRFGMDFDSPGPLRQSHIKFFDASGGCSLDRVWLGDLSLRLGRLLTMVELLCMYWTEKVLRAAKCPLKLVNDEWSYNVVPVFYSVFLFCPACQVWVIACRQSPSSKCRRSMACARHTHFHRPLPCVHYSVTSVCLIDSSWLIQG